jgi:hypothetical protein
VREWDGMQATERTERDCRWMAESFIFLLLAGRGDRGERGGYHLLQGFRDWFVTSE